MSVQLLPICLQYLPTFVDWLTVCCRQKQNLHKSLMELVPEMMMVQNTGRSGGRLT